jgi:NAD-reducing hydrogenase small subunit
MKKITLASEWLEGCSGCHMSFLDMDERLVELIQRGIVITSSPITDLKVPQPGTDVGILEGAVSTDHHEEVAKLFRERCKILIAIGDCAVFGGIVTMRNYIPVNELLKRGYVETESTVEGKIPMGEDIGKHLTRCKALNEVVHVDYYIPGCPPPADAIYQVISDLIDGKIPELKDKLLKYD